METAVDRSPTRLPRRAIAIVLGAIGLGLFLSQPAQAAGPQWRVTGTAGRVDVQVGGKTVTARVGDLLSPGALVRTAPGARATIAHDNDLIFVSPDSQLRLPAEKSARGLMQVLEDYGAAWFRIEHRAQPHFEVRTRYLAAVVKGTVFEVSAGQQGASVRVARGALGVVASAGHGESLVQTGGSAIVAAEHPDRLVLQASAPAADGDTTESTLLAPEAPPQVAAVGDGSTAGPANGASYQASVLADVNPYLLTLGAEILAVLAGIVLTFLLLTRAYRLQAQAGGAGALLPSWRSVVESVFPHRSQRNGGQTSATGRLAKIKMRDLHHPRPVRRQARAAPAPAIPEAPSAPAVEPLESSPEAQRQDPTRRAAPRRKVLLLASVEWVGGACNARLQDISVDGAVAEGETVPPQGIPVILRTVRSTIAAEVVWTGDARFGLRFDQPIDPAALLVEVSRGDRHR